MPFGDVKVEITTRAAFGDSPDGRADILILMAEQADLSAAYNITDWSARPIRVRHPENHR